MKQKRIHEKGDMRAPPAALHGSAGAADLPSRPGDETRLSRPPDHASTCCYPIATSSAASPVTRGSCSSGSQQNRWSNRCRRRNTTSRARTTHQIQVLTIQVIQRQDLSLQDLCHQVRVQLVDVLDSFVDDRHLLCFPYRLKRRYNGFEFSVLF